MSEEAVASTQYGDLKGTVSIDGFDGPFLDKLIAKSEMPKGYWPIGISLWGSHPESGSFTLRFRLICVDSDIAGISGDSIREHAKGHDEIPAFSFPVEVTAEELAELMKRLSAYAFSKVIGDTPVKILEDE